MKISFLVLSFSLSLGSFFTPEPLPEEWFQEEEVKSHPIAPVTSLKPSDILCASYPLRFDQGDQLRCDIKKPEVGEAILTKAVLGPVIISRYGSENTNYTIQDYPTATGRLITSLFLTTAVNLTIKADAVKGLMPNLTDLSVQAGTYLPERKPPINVTIDTDILRAPSLGNVSAWGVVLRKDTLEAILSTDGLPLRQLSLAQGHFPKGLPRGVFNKGGLRNLRHLVLHNENFTNAIEQGAFEGLNELSSLTLKMNRINSLPSGLLQHMGKLEYLDLSMNKLEVLAKDTFSGLVSLSNLQLTSNPINVVHPDTFADLKNLKFLDLENTPIDYFPAGVFGKGAKNLSSININKSPISRINATMFGGLGNLRVLKVAHCSALESIEEGAFDHLVDLRELYMVRNEQLRQLPDGLFRKLSKLEVVDFTGPCIENLSGNNFTHCPNLRIFGNC